MKLNSFQMPNAIWDLDFDVYERAIITNIVRKTIGWGKTTDGISLSQFKNDLKISKPKVISTLKQLESRKLITIKRGRKKGKAQTFNLYSLSENIEEIIKKEKKVVNDIDRGSKPDLQGVVNDIDTQIYTNTINTKQKDYNAEGVNATNVAEAHTEESKPSNGTSLFETSTPISKKEKKESQSKKALLSDNELYKQLDETELELFLEYLDIRKKMKAPITDRILNRLLKKYFEYGRDKSVIEKAIVSGWKDFYAPKQQKPINHAIQVNTFNTQMFG